jgi:hypothetical protein
MNDDMFFIYPSSSSPIDGVTYSYDSNNSPKVLSINPTSGEGGSDLVIQANLTNLNLSNCF